MLLQAVIDVEAEGMVLKEVAEGSSVDEVLAKTEAKLIVADNVGTF